MVFMMPLSTEQVQQLFSLLERCDWKWRDDIIYAPNETMCLSRNEPWVGDVVDFYERMCGRRRRVHANRDKWDSNSAFADVDSLVVALETLLPE